MTFFGRGVKMEKVGEIQEMKKLETGIAVFDREGKVLYTDGKILRWLEGTGQTGLKQLVFEKKTSLPASWIIKHQERYLQMNLYSCQGMVILVVVNLTALKEMEEQLEEAKAVRDELDATIQNSYDAIYIVDANGITRKTNDAIERLTGIPKEYYIGKDMRYLEKRGIVKKSVSFEVMKKKKPVTMVQETATGKVLLMTGSPVFNEEGEVIRVVTNLRDISELNRLKEELSQLRKFHAGDEPVVVESPEMKQVMELAGRVAETDTTVLLLGESGVGKEVIARMIHKNSKRYEKGAFIKVNCGAIPEELLESELFGYESGAFTGAKKEGKAGLFELAHEGTLFLDEIGEMPVRLQVKLLRVLQDQEYRRLGGVKTIKVNTRIIAATNRDLRKMVAEGKFREDLYYRLCVVPIEIPPLRKRPQDIVPMIRFYMEKYNRKYQTHKQMAWETMQVLQNYHWPGNIRELANLIERLLVTTPSDVILPEHLPFLSGGKRTAQNEFAEAVEYLDAEKLGGLKKVMKQMERQIISSAFQKYNSSYEVAKALKISQSTAIRKAYQYGVRSKNKNTGKKRL
jgi:PAS domain S-box-containing protein